MSEQQLKKLVRGCLGKSRYPSEEKAKQYANRAMKARNVQLRTYYCRDCMGFHLTSRVN